MKHLIVFLLFVSAHVQAQVSVQESDSANYLRIFSRQVNFNFFNIASVESDKAGETGGRLSTYSYLTGATWINANYRAALRLPFQYNSAGTDRFNGEKVNESEMFLQDIIIGLQNYNLLYMPLDMELYWEGRAYLPTSKNSKRAGLITRLRNNFILSRVFSRYFEMEYDQKFSYFIQSRSAYSNTFNDEEGYERTVVSTTKNMEIEHSIRAWGKITPQVAVGWMVGSNEEYWNKSDAEQRSKPGRRVWVTGPQLAFPITNNANFILAYEDAVDRDNGDTKELGKFYSKNSQIGLFSFIRF